MIAYKIKLCRLYPARNLDSMVSLPYYSACKDTTFIAGNDKLGKLMETDISYIFGLEQHPEHLLLFGSLP